MLIFNKCLNTKKKRIIFVSILFISILLLSFLYYKLYILYNIGIPCIFFKKTGFYCPGCGITRAIFSLMRLDIKSAIRYNLLIIFVFPFLIYYVCVKIKRWVRFEEVNSMIYSNNFFNLLLIITILFGFLRNIEIFSFLAPM